MELFAIVLIALMSFGSTCFSVKQLNEAPTIVEEVVCSVFALISFTCFFSSLLILNNFI